MNIHYFFEIKIQKHQKYHQKFNYQQKMNVRLQ